MDGLWGWIVISAALLGTAELLWLDRQRRVFFSTALPRANRLGARTTPWLARARRAARGALGAAREPRREQEHVIHEMLATMSAIGVGNTSRPPPWERARGAPADARPVGESAASPEAPDPAVSPLAVMHEPQDTPDLRSTIDVVARRGSDGEVGIVYVDLGGKCTSATQVARDLLGWHSGELTLRDVLAGGAAQSTDLLRLVALQEAIEQQVTVVAGGVAHRRIDVDEGRERWRENEGEHHGRTRDERPRRDRCQPARERPSDVRSAVDRCWCELQHIRWGWRAGANAVAASSRI